MPNPVDMVKYIEAKKEGMFPTETHPKIVARRRLCDGNSQMNLKIRHFSAEVSILKQNQRAYGLCRAPANGRIEDEIRRTQFLPCRR